MKGETNLLMHSEFGLGGIFDNIRDGLVLVRFPEREIVLFNRAAAEMSGHAPKEMMGAKVDRLFADRAVHAKIRRCASQPTGVWPGPYQDVLQSEFRGKKSPNNAVEIHFCRVDPAALAGPLVLLVMRSSAESELERVVTRFSTRLNPKVIARGTRPTPRRKQSRTHRGK